MGLPSGEWGLQVAADPDQITAVSHGVLHLESPIIPERPPTGVPSRTPTHVLFNALTEMFNMLGVVNRSLTSLSGLVQSVLSATSHHEMTYAEVSVLRSSRSGLDHWSGKWVREVESRVNRVIKVPAESQMSKSPDYPGDETGGSSWSSSLSTSTSRFSSSMGISRSPRPMSSSGTKRRPEIS